MFRRHAYLLIGEREFWRKTLETELKKFLKIENLTSSPDIWWQDYESFGLKEAQALMEREARHGFGEQGRFFILGISSMTPEAQNALLKTFEEPALDAHFFIMARTAEIFLPTLRSRLVILTDRQLGSLTSKLKIDAKIERNEVGFCASAEEVVLQVSPKSDFGSADQFLKMDLPERLDFIQKEFLKPKDKKKSEIIDFVIELEKTLRAQINMRQITKDEEFALHELAKCQRYFQNPRSSNRLILEHLALVIPLN
ncbi:MAG: hypothetical protein WC387_02770 [Candidatus Paceibacterota bacterium]